MNRNSRYNNILSLLKSNPDISVTRLSELLGVSQVTVRKYLSQMEKNGELVRVYGKAKLLADPQSHINSCFIEPEQLNDYRAKQIIGSLASDLVEDDDFIFIGPGYTCLELAKQLGGKKRLSIFTTNISAAIELSMFENPAFSETKLRVAPGDFTKRNGTYYVSGLDTIEYFKDSYFDKVFITADGISQRGFTVLDEITAQIYTAIIKPQTKVYICATNEKFGKNAMAPIGPLDLASAVISDAEFPESFASVFREKGVELIYPQD